MDILIHFFNGVLNAMLPMSFMMMLVGLLLGILGGMLPGITAVTTLSLFIPFTFTMPPATALIALGSIYVGSTYGGSIAAILINTPGQPTSMTTALDGYQMTLKGNGRRALDLALLASAFGSVFGVLCLLFFYEPLSTVGLLFGSEAFFWMGIFGLSALATLFPGQVVRSLLAGFLGMALSTVGMDGFRGFPRFTLGFEVLNQGLDMIALMIGVFSITQMLSLMESRDEYLVLQADAKHESLWQVGRSMFKRLKLLLAMSGLGTFVGIMPGTGGTVASILAYNEAKRWSGRPEAFGTGVDEGVIAPEAANNGSVGGALIPLLSLGIPGSASAAIIVGGLMGQGITPGPQLLEKYPEIVYAFIAGLMICSLVMIPVGYAVSRGCVKMLDMPRKYLVPTIITLSCVGTYSMRNSLFDVGVMLAAGGVGYLLLQSKIQPASLALGIVLGPIIENSLVITLARSRSVGSLADLLIFSPLAIFFILCSLVVLTLPFIIELRNRGQKPKLHLTFNASALRSYDFWVFTALGLFTLPFIREASSFHRDNGIYPEFVFGSILGLCLLLLLKILFTHRETAPKRPIDADILKRIAVSFGICALCYALIPCLGFYSSMLLLMISSLVYATRYINNEPVTPRTVCKLSGISLIVVMMEYACFSLLLAVDTPQGIFF